MSSLRKLDPTTSVGELFSSGEISNRTLSAVRRAFIEIYGPEITPYNPRLQDFIYISPEVLLKQPNFGAQSLLKLDAICTRAGVTIGAKFEQQDLQLGKYLDAIRAHSSR